MTKALLLPCLLLPLAVAPAHGAGPLLLQQPTLNQTHVVFAFADDLWSVPRDGGDARRLTTGPGRNLGPVFSPDGKLVAFTRYVAGNADVHVVPASGGEPRRLTYHPEADLAVGWSPDGKRVLFRSQRHDHTRSSYTAKLFTVSLDGGLPEELPLPLAHHGSYSPDGAHIAYVPFQLPEWMPWKSYRGGTASPIWLAKLADSSITRVPRSGSNDSSPMWVGNHVYFLSDRAGPVTLFAYDTDTKKVRKALDNASPGLKSASAGPGAIVYEQFGSLHLFDLETRKARKLNVRIAADLPNVRPRFVALGKQVRGAALSPTGARAAFEARGEIVTVPAKKGSARNLTATPGVAERDPAWSPDGKWIAYFSDESGEYRLHVRAQSGLGEVKKFALGKAPSFYYAPLWSPDGKSIAYTDKRLNLWLIDLATAVSTLVDTNTYDTPFRSLDPAWAPDSKWLAYTKQLDNHLRAVFVYSLPDRKAHRITDGMSDARYAAFDRNGKYLYFTASTDVGLTAGWLDMSSMNRPVTRSVYVVVLDKALPSPLAPESDEEKAPEKKADKKDKVEKDRPVRIDLSDIDQRILSLPVPARDYRGLLAGKSGALFLLEQVASPGWALRELPKMALHKFELDKRKSDRFLDGLARAAVSHDGEKLLYQQGPKWFLVGTAAPPKAGEGLLELDEVEVPVEPRAEWRQMYREVWRIQRDFLYDPGHHGLDLKAAAKKYEPYLEGVASRNDLNYLFQEMLSELTLGHTFVRGGDFGEQKPSKGGLLGADYAVEKGKYRFGRVYRGQNWSPELRSPLTQPGASVKAGEYLLAVNGRPLAPPESVYRPFEGTAGKTTVLRVGPSADGKGARDVTVVPISSEEGLRHRAWVEDNRSKVDKLSKGRVGYVYLPNTSVEGLTSFNRYFFAQTDKEGVVLDERFNRGGSAADYVIDHLRRPLMNYWSTREGKDFTTPLGAVFGPKAMIVNEMAGSGGDLMPWMFRRAELGPLVGKRTWGGLVGIYDYPSLLDGGFLTAPRLAFWSPEGAWEVENVGVAPDVEVEHDPQAVRAGHDPQLEKAVQLVLEALEKAPRRAPRRPAYPNYHPKKEAKTR